MLRKHQASKDFSSVPRAKEKKHVYSIFSFALTVFLLFSFSVLPIEFCRAVGSPTFLDSREYPTGLIDEGSEGAGLRGRDDEYAFLPHVRSFTGCPDKLDSFPVKIKDNNNNDIYVLADCVLVGYSQMCI